MTLQIEAKHNLTPNEIDTIEDRLYDHNSYATGCRDGQGLGFVIRDEVGQMIGAAAGFTWSVFLNLNRCGSMRLIEDAVTRAHCWVLLSRRVAIEAFVGSG